MRKPSYILTHALCAAVVALGLTTAAALAQTTSGAPVAQSSPGIPSTTPQHVTEAVPTPVAIGGASSLPRDLSPWGMFKSADIVVKLVMLGLAFASLVTWTVAVAKALELRNAGQAIRRDLVALTAAASIADAGHHLESGQGAWALVDAAATEMQASSDVTSSEGIKERVVSLLQRLEAGAGRAMMRGTGLLATIGATAPFVGLFGTVWGIMNSFIGISKLHTTNLAIVAPGIAEALLATAMGLVVAIPAVVIYNAFSRAIAAHRALYADAAAAVLRLTSRDLDRPASFKPVASQGASAPRLRSHP